MINMRFLVDESVGNRFAKLMRNSGYDAVFVGDVMPEVDDALVLSFADREIGVLITADKDFGELIFKIGRSSAGVILIRTTTRDPEKRFEMVKD